MKSQSCLFLFLCLTLLASCNKAEFKEQKIAATIPTTSSVPSIPQAMENKQTSQNLPPGHPPINGKSNSKEDMSEKVEILPKATGGFTVQECFAGKNKLTGKKISVRGKVVKYNSGILKRNWLHIKDGTGAEGKNDLIITTTDSAKLNDIVVVSGTIQYDKDIGSGYFFPVIIEDASLKIEK